MAKHAYLSPSDVDAARQRRLEAMQSQAIAGNPLSFEQVAMFEMFEREAWPHDRRRAYILARGFPWGRRERGRLVSPRASAGFRQPDGGRRGLVSMALRTAALLPFLVVALSACDGKTAAENHREAAGQQTVGGLKQSVGGLTGDKALQKAGQAQSDRGRTNEKVGNFKDAVHKAVH